jgi:MFS family permease
MGVTKGYGTLKEDTDILFVESVEQRYRQMPTMDPRTWFKDLTPYFLYLVLVATIGPMLFGYHLAELNTPQEVITCKKKSLFDSSVGKTGLPQCIPMNATELGVVSSLFTLGGFIGAMVGGPAGNKYGRLRTMMGTIFFFVLGPIFEALSPNIGVMALGRLISGIGAGASVVVVPIYISEISPPDEKGFFGSLTQVMVNFGIFTTQLLGYVLSHGQMWRLVLALGGAIGAAGGFGLLFSAESPKWTADQGKGSKAKKTLIKIRGDKFDVEGEYATWGVHDHEDVPDEEETLLDNSDANSDRRDGTNKGKKEHLTMWQAVVHPDSRKAIVGVVAVMIAQQLTGKSTATRFSIQPKMTIQASTQSSCTVSLC